MLTVMQQFQTDILLCVFDFQSRPLQLYLFYHAFKVMIKNDIMIYSQANVGKCFIGPLAKAGRFVWVCQGLCVLQSVFPSILLPIFHPSFCLAFCHFRSVSFLGIYTLVFCDIWHGIRDPCGIVCGIFTEKSGLSKNDQKMVKNGPKMGFLKR